MDNKEAVKWLTTFQGRYGLAELEKAVEIAIKALEQEPCELPIKEKCAYCPHCTNCDVNDDLSIKSCTDAISRQAAIDAFEKRAKLDWERLKILAPLLEEIEQLPPVSVAEKVGEWIDQGYKEEWWEEYYKCSNCGAGIVGRDNYCPNCGARMVKPQESEE